MKKKSILIVLAVLFVFIAVAPIRETLAYFTAYAPASGEGKVDLTWNTKLDEEIDENQRDKHITVTNTGKTPVVVRVSVFADEAYTTYSYNDSDWTKNSDGWWYYTKVLAPGESTSVLDVLVKVENVPDYDFNIIVVHESSRAIYKNGSTTELEKPDGWAYVPAVA